MDVVCKNIEKIGGSVSVDSVYGKGTTFIIKIPMTLVIISGMTVKVGQGKYTIPMNSIRECFRPNQEKLIEDSDGNEMIMIRGQCYPIMRIHSTFKVKTDITKLTDGIIIMIENADNPYCIFADSLIGEQQIVMKSLPRYIKKAKGLAGCTLLGDGRISLIIDVESFGL